MKSIKIVPIPILSDNYVWTLIDEATNNAIIVDPGDAAPVAQYIDQHQLHLLGILITHRHWDHTNGVLALKERYHVPVITPANDPVDGSTQTVAEGDTVTLPNFPVTFEVLDIPAHTRGHVAYVGAGGVFCGDTLFSAGCGRLFEGTPAQMVAALAKLTALPDSTKVYCAHEYTLNNLRFAETVEPLNTDIKAYRENVKAKLAAAQTSLPSTMAIEMKVNPFLRCDMDAVVKSAEAYSGMTLNNQVDVFRCIREWKDAYA